MPIEGDSAMKLADMGNIMPDVNDTSQISMATTVMTHPGNPLVGKNATDNNTLSINSAVIMLSMTNSSGGPIDLGQSSYL